MPDPAAGPAEVPDRRAALNQVQEIAALAGGLAHEIRNPLSTIRLNLGLLAEDFGDAKELREQRALRKIQVLQREVDRLDEMLSGFLRYARAQETHRAPCDVNRLVQDMADFIAPQAARAGVTIACYFAPDRPECRIDRSLMQQCLLNILLNAQQAMPTGGQLTLQTRKLTASVQIEVIDTGCGMDPDTLAKLFRPFFSTRKEGSGLGLPTSRRIVEAHEGTMRVESEPGKGTRVTIELPI